MKSSYQISKGDEPADLKDLLAAVRQVGDDARKLAQMLVTHEGHCLAVNHGTFDGKAMVGGDNLANYDAAMAGDAARLARRCTSLSMSSRNMPRKARRTPAADVGLRWPDAHYRRFAPKPSSPTLQRPWTATTATEARRH